MSKQKISNNYRFIVNPSTGRKVSIFGKKGLEVIENFLYNSVGGGNDNHFPGEFFGNDSGRYSSEPQALGESAYGQQIAVSHGVESVEGMVGPDMGPSPGHSGVQTGGSRIFVKTLTGRTIEVNAYDGDKVQKIFEQVAEELNTTTDSIRIIFKGVELFPTDPVTKEMLESSNLHVIFLRVDSMKKKGGSRIFVKTLTGRTIEVNAYDGDKVQKIFEQVAEELNTTTDSIRIIFKGVELFPTDPVTKEMLESSNLHVIFSRVDSMKKKGGGNDNHFPAEFFGNDSGRYSSEPQALGESAYGQQIAVSHGVESVEGMVGPDMGPSPGHSGVQTGGSSAFDKIINPATGRSVSIYGKIGRQIIKGYLQESQGGNMLVAHIVGKNISEKNRIVYLTYSPGDTVQSLLKQISEKFGETADIKITFMGEEIKSNRIIEGELLEEFMNHGTVYVLVSKDKKGGSWGSSKEILEDFQTGGWGAVDLLPF